MKKMSEEEYLQLCEWWHDNYHYDGPEKHYEDCSICKELVDKQEKDRGTA